MNELIGKTISNATFLCHKEYDDQGFVYLQFTDGSSALLTAYYSGYTGDSKDEYPTCMDFEMNPDIAHLKPMSGQG